MLITQASPSKDPLRLEAFPRATSQSNMIEARLIINIDQLENAYFTMISQNPDDRLRIFFDGLCKYARYSTFEVCETLRNADLCISDNVICSLSFDRDGDFFTVAGVPKKIKIFDIHNLLDDSINIYYQASALSHGYPTSVNTHGGTRARLTISEQELQREIGARRCEKTELIVRRFIGRQITMESAYRVCDTGNYCAYPAFLTRGNNNFDVFELENSDENQCNQEKNEPKEFEDPHLEDLYSQTLAKCTKLGKLNKVLKDQVNILTSELQERTESTSHEIEVLENEKQGLHDKVVLLKKEINDEKEKMKSTLDEFYSAKLDVVLSQHKLQKFYHGAMNIDKMLCMGKLDSDKRGLGYEESLSKAKAPQITKFVKATAFTSMSKHNALSTTHDHSKRASYSKINYCNLCGRRGHIAFFCRFVGYYQSHAFSNSGYKYNSNVISTNVKSNNVSRFFAQKTTGRGTLRSIWV
ncbi:hypothetical protein GIB67_024387 [Kingdonia uniflora]|uniref:Uncharacterized protein n=1 Tax=Kingdonia uniflora TaxID=39325 RepID=A0A7J7LF97_9MAGN|nr:hypothetical protein GIB67_024387 [Kingdonia uniflora]